MADSFQDIVRYTLLATWICYKKYLMAWFARSIVLLECKSSFTKREHGQWFWFRNFCEICANASIATEGRSWECQFLLHKSYAVSERDIGPLMSSITRKLPLRHLVSLLWVTNPVITCVTERKSIKSANEITSWGDFEMSVSTSIITSSSPTFSTMKLLFCSSSASSSANYSVLV